MTIKLTKSMFSWFCLATMMVFGLQLNAQSSTMVIGTGTAAGTYDIGHSLFSPNFASLSGTLSSPEDGSGNAEACATVTNDLTGTIALVDFRNNCLAELGAANAVAAGAIGVVICNAFDGGTAGVIRGTGGVDLMVPVVSLDSVSCVNIRMAMAMDPVTVGIVGPAPGETCISAITAAEGLNSATMSTSGLGGTIFQFGTQATWYEYTAPIDGILTISSCGGGANTRLIGFFVDDCLGTNAALNNNQFFASVDECDDGIGGATASEVVFIVNAGLGIRFLWDDAQSTDAFDFSITTVDFPELDVTLNVDMTLETVDPAGVFVTGNMTGGTPAAMTDDGDGTYSYTYTAQTNDVATYLFSNGAVQENVADLGGCGNGTERVFDVLFDMDVSVPLVCWESCDACILGNCANTALLICEDMEDFTVGDLAGQSPNWNSWSGDPSAADNAVVSADQALSGSQSVYVSEANEDDAVLVLGVKSSGKYGLSWSMYVPSGSDAYWNIQKIETGFSGAGADFNMQTPMVGGTGEVNHVGAVIETYTYPEDAWFPIHMVFDLDNDENTLFVNGVEVASWLASETITAGPGAAAIGAINFFGNTNNAYYIDDVSFQVIDVEADECNDLVAINDLFGGDVDDTQTSDLLSNIGFGTNGSDPMLGFECYVEPDGGGATPSLENTMWYTFVGDGATYSITSVECTATDFIDFGDTQMSLYSGVCGNLTNILCNEDAAGVDPNGPYPAQIDFETEIGVAYYLMIDGFLGSDGEFCLEVTKTAEYVPPTSMVTFNVDLGLETTPADTAFFAGEPNGWMGEPMDFVADNRFTITLELEEGDTIEYKFQNGLNVWEDNIEGGCTADNGNRFVIVGEDDMTLDEVCFRYCVTCIMVGLDAVALNEGIHVYPNPASEVINIAYDFNETIELNVSITNTLGQTVKQLPINTVDQGMINVNIAELSTGIYFLNFRHNNVLTTKKIVIE